MMGLVQVMLEWSAECWDMSKYIELLLQYWNDN